MSQHDETLCDTIAGEANIQKGKEIIMRNVRKGLVILQIHV